MIEVKNLDYFVGNNKNSKQILKDISFTFEKGKFYGIIGPNGSGKTTFLDLISGYKKSNFNNKNSSKNKKLIKIDKKNLEDYKPNDLAKKIAIVPQKFDIAFDFLVSDILEMGRYPYKKKFMSLSKKDYEIIEKVTKEVELEKFLSKDITRLSGGEEQRVIFGKALIQDTPILLLDESTSNLDPYHSHSLLKIVRDKVELEKTTVVGVFHDFNLASLYCDELLLFEDGKLVASGKTNEILKSDKLGEVFKIKWDTYEKKDKTFVIPKV